MLYEIIEKYWKDILNQNIWDWLGISYNTWRLKKYSNKSYLEKIQKYFDVTDLSENDLLLYIVKNYIKINKK